MNKRQAKKQRKKMGVVQLVVKLGTNRNNRYYPPEVLKLALNKRATNTVIDYITEDHQDITKIGG